jgi:cephalosporin-C deacetylase-like acetyl esterase
MLRVYSRRLYAIRRACGRHLQTLRDKSRRPQKPAGHETDQTVDAGRQQSRTGDAAGKDCRIAQILRHSHRAEDSADKISVNQEKIPADFKSEELTFLSDETFRVFLVECNTVNDCKCYAYLRLPRSGAPMPLMVYYEGAGVGMCQEHFKLHCETADKWLPERVAQLSIFTHPYRPPVTRAEHEVIHEKFRDSFPNRSYWDMGLDKGPEHTFFYRGILGSVRMINYVTAMPEIDPDRIAYLGASQGGGFGVYLTALCPQIRAACCGVPAFCNCGGFLAGHHPTTSRDKAFREYYEVMRYFDVVNFASMIKVLDLSKSTLVFHLCIWLLSINDLSC